MKDDEPCITCDDNTTALSIFVLLGLDGDIERTRTIPDAPVSQSGESQLLQCIVGI